MSFVKVKEEHFPIIQNIAYKTWPITFRDILSDKQIEYMLDMMYSSEAIQNQIQNLNQNYLLYQDENKAYLGYVSYEIDYIPQTTKIHKIYVLPDAQGKGIGKELLEKVEIIAISENNIQLTLNVNRNNKAKEFYEYLDFFVVGEEDIDIGDGFLMEDFIMNKLIIN